MCLEANTPHEIVKAWVTGEGGRITHKWRAYLFDLSQNPCSGYFISHRPFSLLLQYHYDDSR